MSYGDLSPALARTQRTRPLLGPAATPRKRKLARFKMSHLFSGIGPKTHDSNIAAVKFPSAQSSLPLIECKESLEAVQFTGSIFLVESKC